MLDGVPFILPSHCLLHDDSKGNCDLDDILKQANEMSWMNNTDYNFRLKKSITGNT